MDLSTNAILSVAQMTTADSITVDGDTSGFDLLSAAGQQVYEVVRGLISESDRILVACGLGNNGGDGLVAARLLCDEGFDVTVALLGSPDSIYGDARLALEALNRPIQSLAETPPDRFTLIVDALLGSGIDRPITGLLADWINRANISTSLIVSVDIATGIHGDSGAVCGTAMEAQHTVTFFRKKTGHVLFPGRHHCGLLHVRQIGISESVLEKLTPAVHENDCALWRNAITPIGWHSHKYSRGHSVVLTGDALSTGAARLAGHAALRSGAGVVTLACPAAAASAVATHVTCELIRVIDTVDQFQQMLSDQRITSAVLGPGMGVGLRTRQMVHAACGNLASVVLDADALTSFEDCPDELFKCIADAKGGVVITPHRGEFKRLFGSALGSDATLVKNQTVSSSAISKIDQSTEAARLSGAVVVLKGPDTVIADPEGHCAVNTNAPFWLATAGSGDVLAGTIAGWLAQGVTVFEAACLGCWMHSEAARLFGPGLIATDIAEQYPQVCLRLQNTIGNERLSYPID